MTPGKSVTYSYSATKYEKQKGWKVITVKIDIRKEGVLEINIKMTESYIIRL